MPLAKSGAMYWQKKAKVPTLKIGIMSSQFAKVTLEKSAFVERIEAIHKIISNTIIPILMYLDATPSAFSPNQATPTAGIRNNSTLRHMGIPSSSAMILPAPDI